jgi:hypothetical protein
MEKTQLDKTLLGWGIERETKQCENMIALAQHNT